MCLSERIAANNGVKNARFSSRGKKSSTTRKRPEKIVIIKKKLNRLSKKNPKRALQLFRSRKRAEKEKRIEATQKLIDRLYLLRGKKEIHQ